MRQLVSYDDISLPQAAGQSTAPEHSGQPPQKKRKKSNQRSRRNQQVRHWDDPDRSGDKTISEEGAADIDEDGEDESRELTHDEVWDDSALIDAWNSATAEYEEYHGPTKDWKNQSVKKSPLWFNVPITRSSHNAASAVDISQDDLSMEDDSKPIDFESFVPTHDPSLALPELPDPPPVSEPNYLMSSTYNPLEVDQDEAFSRALNAMYWGGYWTAVYHCQKRSRQGQNIANTNDEQNHVEDEDSGLEPEDDVNLVPTQR
ncbi:hypothetical protein SERLA73DRAFT_192009 [Serpula lacrymans var. lacrymans S7.3]|uniref:Survival Motor Neuron Gemin2-binding domain-containing protein n=2 Tax=Serpula lacrymans var. lacrymans TaxID=341189 RepID=F8QIS5_SERL3|nr:uncharacterized protein SERLADRAFT_479094 [Serpula lacrymans var. lacrymans S7.9]EGN91797.1 hypothetical protein SERLA73DRAFT_192009 [Serpula lacrymans var. lacrymans S7.3]EGO19543.1 hypothetical protein SERLADRAFT_479094 [Serpula lacrymans var. lacrymans S7.9]